MAAKANRSKIVPIESLGVVQAFEWFDVVYLLRLDNQAVRLAHLAQWMEFDVLGSESNPVRTIAAFVGALGMAPGFA